MGASPQASVAQLASGAFASASTPYVTPRRRPETNCLVRDQFRRLTAKSNIHAVSGVNFVRFRIWNFDNNITPELH